MTTQELRDLDEWICENVFGHDVSRKDWQPFALEIAASRPDQKYYYERNNFLNSKKYAYPHAVPNYTTDPAAAMDVLKKCVEKDGADATVEICCVDAGFRIRRADKRISEMEFAETLELAICLFAKKLFTK